MFYRRGIPRDDPWLDLKLWLFGIGALLALLGMALHRSWLIGAAGLILLAGFLLRFLPHGSPDGEEPEQGTGEPDA